MKFIVDSMLPRDLVALLRQHGHEATHVHRLGISGASDESIWKYAEESEAILISKDSDFEHFAAKSIRAKLVHYKRGNMATLQLLADFTKELSKIEESVRLGKSIIVVAAAESH